MFSVRENWKVNEDKGVAFQYTNLAYSDCIQSCSPLSSSIAVLKLGNIQGVEKRKTSTVIHT